MQASRRAVDWGDIRADISRSQRPRRAEQVVRKILSAGAMLIVGGDHAIPILVLRFVTAARSPSSDRPAHRLRDDVAACATASSPIRRASEGGKSQITARPGRARQEEGDAAKCGAPRLCELHDVGMDEIWRASPMQGTLHHRRYGRYGPRHPAVAAPMPGGVTFQARKLIHGLVRRAAW
jgi:hypothetical protein